MSICDSEENRKKLAWLVPGYILLAWFFCVLFQPLGIHTPPSGSSRSSVHHHHDKNYEVIYLDADSSAQLCNNGILTLEEGSKSAMIIRLGRHQHIHKSYNNFAPFNCSLQVRAGKSLDGVVAVVEEMDLREHSDVGQPGGHWGSSVCLDYVELYSYLDNKNSFEPKQQNKLCGSWKVIGNEGITSHGTQKNLIGYCYDRDLESPNHSCGTNHIHINTVINSNLELARRYNSNGLNIGKGDKGFSIVVTGYKHPKKLERVPKKHNKPSVARMQTQWASGIRSKEQVEMTTHRYANFLFPNIPKLFDLSTTTSMNVEKSMHNDKADEKRQHYMKKSNWDPERKVANYLSDIDGQDDGTDCSDYELMCQVTEFSNKRGMMHSNRCIWKQLKCDYHQNCGFTYNNDEINCSSTTGGFEDGDTVHGGGLNGNPIPWSISTMSLLIIIYLAIVLILVLVTMLLLRWHRALRTPLDVLSESRYTSALGRSIDGVTTVSSTPHGFQSHAYGELTITSSNLEAALAEADPTRSGDIDGAIAGIETSAAGRTQGTVSIMVMYRPQKSPKVPLSAAELPPSYDSLFTEERPPNYSRIANTVNLPTLDEEGLDATEDANNVTTSIADVNTQLTLVRNVNQISMDGIITESDNSSSTSNNPNQGSAVSITPRSETSTTVQDNSLPSSIDSSEMAASSSNASAIVPAQNNSNISEGCENIENNDDETLMPSLPVLRPLPFENSGLFGGNEEHCQCDCDHTNCNNSANSE